MTSFQIRTTFCLLALVLAGAYTVNARYIVLPQQEVPSTVAAVGGSSDELTGGAHHPSDIQQTLLSWLFSAGSNTESQQSMQEHDNTLEALAHSAAVSRLRGDLLASLEDAGSRDQPDEEDDLGDDLVQVANRLASSREQALAIDELMRDISDLRTVDDYYFYYGIYDEDDEQTTATAIERTFGEHGTDADNEDLTDEDIVTSMHDLETEDEANSLAIEVAYESEYADLLEELLLADDYTVVADNAATSASDKQADSTESAMAPLLYAQAAYQDRADANMQAMSDSIDGDQPTQVTENELLVAASAMADAYQLLSEDDHQRAEVYSSMEIHPLVEKQQPCSHTPQWIIEPVAMVVRALDTLLGNMQPWQKDSTQEVYDDIYSEYDLEDAGYFQLPDQEATVDVDIEITYSNPFVSWSSGDVVVQTMMDGTQTVELQASSPSSNSAASGLRNTLFWWWSSSADEPETEDDNTGVLLLAGLLLATAAMLVSFVKTFMQLRRAMRHEVLVPFVIQQDGELRQGYMLLSEDELDAATGASGSEHARKVHGAQTWQDTGNCADEKALAMEQWQRQQQQQQAKQQQSQQHLGSDAV